MAGAEATPVEHDAGGLVPEGEGWIIMNAADRVSYRHEEHEPGPFPWPL